MLASVLAFVLAPIPTGSYGMPELCLKLRAATGVAHTVDAELKDYPVFVSTKSGDPERVKSFVATAFRAEWKKEGDRFRLAPIKVDANAGYPEFEWQYKRACAGKPNHLALPLKDLYQMPVGATIRYSYPQNNLTRALPEALRKPVVASGQLGFVTVMRQAQGLFNFRFQLPDFEVGAFSEGGQIEFKGLPKDIADALGPDASKQALNATEQAAIQAMASGPAAMKIDWSDLNKRDPMATLSESVLVSISKQVTKDMAVALPDLAIFTVGAAGHGDPTVGGLLAPLSTAI